MPDAGLPKCSAKDGCDKDAYCDFEPGDMCGAGKGAEGVCRPRPTNCPADCPGVCGCDGKFYCNACGAHSDGVDDTSSDSCRPDAGPGTECKADDDCRLGLKCCAQSGPGPGNGKICTLPTPMGECP
jgi:hypothetical protein